MSHVEPVRRDARSYRQGLVLGLTMAEVFLLLVFALLIALASLWNAERQKRIALERQQGQPPIESAVDRRLWDDVKDAIKRASPDSVINAIDHLRNGRELEPLTPAEKDFLSEARRQQSGATPGTISDQWRTLTRAVKKIDSLPGMIIADETIKRLLPDEKDRERLGSVIEKGLAAEKKGEHDWPPIINLSEAKDCFFETGKAELTKCFETRLTAIVPQLLDLAQQFGVRTIEVIGHTDEQRIIQRYSNLNEFLVGTLHSDGNVSSLIPADNAGLGLARATAVVRALSRDKRLNGYTLLPLSGGQLIGVNDRLTSGGGGDEQERRRIEIRVRRANNSQASTDASQPPAKPRPKARPPAPRPSPKDQVANPKNQLATPSWFPFGAPPAQR
jgi:flagellar motor protein MotB